MFVHDHSGSWFNKGSFWCCVFGTVPKCQVTFRLFASRRIPVNAVILVTVDQMAGRRNMVRVKNLDRVVAVRVGKIGQVEWVRIGM